MLLPDLSMHSTARHLADDSNTPSEKDHAQSTRGVGVPLPISEMVREMAEAAIRPSRTISEDEPNQSWTAQELVNLGMHAQEDKLKARMPLSTRLPHVRKQSVAQFQNVYSKR